MAPHIEAVKSLDTAKFTERERSHVKAFLTYASGNLPQAIEEWVSILVDYPLGESSYDSLLMPQRKTTLHCECKLLQYLSAITVVAIR